MWLLGWPGILVPMNILNIWITWAFLELAYGQGEVYCWEEYWDGVGGLYYICNVYAY